ncbi:protein of unknown function [Candidatus Promineifilum breve]|uniref:Antitoxin FitA-like ribbon-helix-helix domain-containing protein n=1 Tax=Candidatus Promineifilum breve TaxID=1806508 RepID=A0A170PFZ6_9CHLR|nr:Arc family DNA-binding protein [Candidatus Promineifilum breve]CUS03473.2 protein of unknown function [Candidatus Promineifilum breve]
MTDLLIRQVPDDLHTKLKKRARANRRSMNQEILILLEQFMDQERPVVPVLPSPLRGAFPIDDDWLWHAREEGRVSEFLEPPDQPSAAE